MIQLTYKQAENYANLFTKSGKKVPMWLTKKLNAYTAKTPKTTTAKKSYKRKK